MPEIEMHPVSSSNIATVGYEPDSQTLQVCFMDGATYQYFNVEEHVFQELMQAGSKGQYLNRNIKDTYDYQRV